MYEHEIVIDESYFSPENFSGPEEKMNPEVKKLWIEKLETENIPQTHNRLGKLTGERCCLGVLCDIAVEQGIIPEPTPIDSWADSTLAYTDGFDTEQAILPRKVAEWANIDPRGQLNYADDGTAGHSLAALNDNGASFPKIAAIIREHF